MKTMKETILQDVEDVNLRDSSVVALFANRTAPMCLWELGHCRIWKPKSYF